MSTKKLNIMFMGTPDFAVECLDKLLKSKHNIVGVVSSEDKKAGRGKKIKISDVKQYCIEKSLKIFQPNKLTDINFINEIIKLNPDLIIVVAFRMLPKILWEIPKLGTINLHASLLPNLRGAAPIHWAIINGLKETGLTTFYINDKIDCGNIIEQSKVKINDYENTGELYNKLKKIGSELLINSIDLIQEKSFKSKVQENSTDYLLAPKLNKKNTRINWNNNSKEISNQIRGLSPFPVAWSTLESNNKILKIYKSSINNSFNDRHNPGKIIINKNKIFISTKDGLLEIIELQLEGKRKMTSHEFINGYKNLNKEKLI